MDGDTLSGYRDRVRAAFYAWQRRPRGQLDTRLIVAPTTYAGRLSAGREVPGLLLTIAPKEPRRARVTPDGWQPPADAMASVRARRAERQAAASTDRRRRYDWQPVHGHTLSIPHSRYEQHRIVGNLRQSWHAWKRQRVDAGDWTPDEAHCWRLRLAPEYELMRVTVIDIRQQPREAPPAPHQADTLAATSFDQIFDGMEAALEAGIPRTVTVAAAAVDREIAGFVADAAPPAADDPTSPDYW